MTNWMLYEFAKNHAAEAIQHRLDWYGKQAQQWLEELVKASDNLSQAKSRLQTSESQVKCYARQIKELTELAREFNKGG